MTTSRGTNSSAERRGGWGLWASLIALAVLVGAAVLDAGSVTALATVGVAPEPGGDAVSSGAQAFNVIVDRSMIRTALEFAFVEYVSAPRHRSTAAPSAASSTRAVEQVAPPKGLLTDPRLRGTRLLDALAITPAELGFTISFHPAHDRLGGLMYPRARHIDVFVRPEWSDNELRHVVAHEIGHAFDAVRHAPAERAAWKQLRGIAPETAWWARPYQSDFAAPSGDFAECFAAWAVDSEIARSRFGSCDGTERYLTELVTR